MWTRLVRGGVFVLAFAALACASNPAPRKQPAYTRSAALDYADPPRSASDGKVMGAQEQAPEDWILVLPTNEHLATGWDVQSGRLRFRQERARGGHGALVEEPSCAPPPLAAPVRSEGEVKARAALYRAWLETQQSPYVALSTPAVAELATVQPHVLECDR